MTIYPDRLAALAAMLSAATFMVACGGDGSSNGEEIPAEPGVVLQRAYPNLTFDSLVAMAQAPGNGSRWYVVERLGTIKRFDATDEATAVSTPAITVQVDASGEGGLLGFALHPDFADNGQAFLSYTVTGPSADTPLISRVSRVRSGDGGQTFDPATEETLLSLDQPFTNHNRGHIAFGPDTRLYVGFGDGGSGGDPFNNAQNTGTLLGKLLRIDVDSASPYGIPPDNPFINGGGRPEIYAYGLRNPWRFSFDSTTGRLWLGDVGQDAREEVDVIAKGGNYGWRCYEGSFEYDLTDCGAPNQYRAPISDYGHDEGQSIIGGFVYRGEAIPMLQGVYVFGDFITGTIWGLFPIGSGGFERRVLVESDLGIVSFSQDRDGELYVVDLLGGGLYRLAPNRGA